MPKHQNAPNFRPHDRYFEQVFKNLPLVRQLLSNFLLPLQLAEFDLDTLELTAESFLSEELREALLLQKVPLAFKHANDREFWRQNFREMFMFVGENLPQEIVEGIFPATLLYFHSVTNFNDQEMANLAAKLPPWRAKNSCQTTTISSGRADRKAWKRPCLPS